MLNGLFLAALVTADFGGKLPYDLGLTVARPDAQVNIDRRSLAVCLTQVPCAQYQRAYVTCAVDPDPRKDRFFTLRLTRYVTAERRKWMGRAYSAMADSFVDLETAEKTRVGETVLNGRTVPLWRVEVPLKTGDIPDIVFGDGRGDFLETKGRYLDLELMGRVHAHRTPPREERVNTDRAFTSAVTVFGVELEEPSVEMEMRPVEPGNIFHNDEPVETRVALRVKKSGNYELGWTISDADGQVVATERRPVSESGELTLPLAHPGPGWYSLDFELRKGSGRVLLSHNAAFAVLGKDTRESRMGELYGTWSPFSGHYRCEVKDPKERELGLKILYKAGFRRAFDVARTVPYTERIRWRVGDVVAARFPSDWWGGKRDEKVMKDVIAQRLRENPNAKKAMIFHESYPNPGMQSYECFGAVPDPKKIPAVMPERLKEAARCSKFLRENFPDVKIMIGNSIASSKFVAELLAGGFPETGADFAGLEAVGEASLPEMLSSRSSQAAEFMRETLKCFDCKWGLTQCFESNFRTDTLLGEERQAEWYVRDVLLAHLWKFDDIYVGGAINAGNHYTATVWGDSDICRRMPYCYPKKAYVALATATKVLDGVTDREVLDTGDRTVYAVRYTCRRGRQAYALWTSRGTAEVRLGLRGVCSACDMYGRTISAEERMTVGERPLYLLGGTRPFVTSARVASRSFPETVVPPDFRVVVPADDDEAWEVVPGELAGVQCANEWPARVAGRGMVRKVLDDERDDVLELELIRPDLTLKPLVAEYMYARLKEPVRVDSPFSSVGAWVKGNSGWGELYFVLRDANGRRTVSCSTGMQGKLDAEGRQVMCYSGWDFVSFPVLQSSSIRELSSGVVSWNWTGGSPVKFPVSIDGLVFSARSRPLFLAETAKRPYRQAIRVRDIGVFDVNRPTESPDYVSYDTVGKIDLRTPAVGATNVAPDKVEFAWDGTQKPPYVVEVREIPSGKVVYSGEVGTNRLEVASLRPGQVHAWSVRWSTRLAEGTFKTGER